MARAIIAGAGVLPQLVMAAGPAEWVALPGASAPDGQSPLIHARYEQLGAVFAALDAAGVREICFAGSASRQRFDGAALDAETRALLPRIEAAQHKGDDALLREVVAIFEGRGFTVRAAHELRPDLLAGDGALHGSAAPGGDAARARAVLAALGPLDVGQAAVAARGQVIGIETLQGTDAMLAFVADTAPGSGGVLVKRPKPGQDLRVDMPAIGPATIHAAAAAGLTGVELAAGRTLLLDREAVIAACRDTGLNLWAVP
ncbi:MAG: UDP-2,3-diacylglucosamine diphosphatase LpxI [Rhodobacteraceae bacterium]|nr:UDP-2,3-diacylglucosamine diphosphatase LpxI [Paracoccaceae bacterium]